MIWILFLNDMRFPQMEMTQPLCQAPSIEALMAFILDEKCEPYREGPWGKVHRKDGPLEWFNPPVECELYRYYQQIPERVQAAGCVEYSNPVCFLPTIEALLSSFPPFNRLERIKNAP